MSRAVAAFLLASLIAYPASQADLAVTSAFRRVSSGPAQYVVWQRSSVTDELDLVLSVAKEKPTFFGHSLGLFLQERNNPDRVYLLGVKSDFEECFARLERATATDVILSCRPEKGPRNPNQKWVYDVKAKKLFAHYSYKPVAFYQAFPHNGGAVLVGTDTRQFFAVEYRAERERHFRILGENEADPWIYRAEPNAIGLNIGGTEPMVHIQFDPASPPKNAPRLPATLYGRFAASRPSRVKDGYGPNVEIRDEIGPWTTEGKRVWFGKTFYDGEGMTGVGGFGYYDMPARKPHLITGPEIANWSVSAICVNAEAVWMGLVVNGEWGSTSGGFLRYDKSSGAMHRIEHSHVTHVLIQVGSRIVAATDGGIVIIEEDSLSSFMLDRTTDGRLRMVPSSPQLTLQAFGR